MLRCLLHFQHCLPRLFNVTFFSSDLNHVYNAWLYSVFSVNGTCTKLIYEGQCQGFLPDYLPNTEKNLVDLGLSDNKISKRYVLKRLNLNIKMA